MKKRLVFILTMTLLLLCSACAPAEERRPEVQPPTGIEVEPTKPTAPVVGSPSASLAAPKEGYAYGNMQKNVPSGNFMVNGNSVLFTHNNTLYSYDLNTATVETFCRDATCGHNTDDCPAYKADGNLEQVDGTVYAAHMGDSVLELKGGRFQPITDKGISHFWHGGGKLYVATQDGSLLVYNGTKPQILLDEYTGFWETVFGDYLYFSSSYSVCRVDLLSGEKEVLIKDAEFVTDGRHIYYAPDDTFSLYRCDMDGGNPELLVKDPVLPAAWNFDDDYFYFRLYTEDDLDSEDGKTLFRFSKNQPDEVEEIARMPAPISQVYTAPGYDKIFVTLRNDTIYAMSRDGSDIQLLELPNF